MRSWILSLVLLAGTLGLVALTPAESQAFPFRTQLYYPYYPGYVYYPPIQSYYTSPAYSYNYSYYAPSPYVAPSYGYSASYYTPGYAYTYPTYYRSYYRPYYYAPTYYYP
jgi:hypothetical protein